MKTEMTDDEIHQSVLASLHFVAPEVDLVTLNANNSIRDQVDIDSLDFVRFIIRLHEVTGIEVPESDYPQLKTLKSCTEYIKRKLKSPENQTEM